MIVNPVHSKLVLPSSIHRQTSHQLPIRIPVSWSVGQTAVTALNVLHSLTSEIILTNVDMPMLAGVLTGVLICMLTCVAHNASIATITWSTDTIFTTGTSKTLAMRFFNAKNVIFIHRVIHSRVRVFSASQPSKEPRDSF